MNERCDGTLIGAPVFSTLDRFEYSYLALPKGMLSVKPHRFPLRVATSIPGRDGLALAKDPFYERARASLRAVPKSPQPPLSSPVERRYARRVSKIVVSVKHRPGFEHGGISSVQSHSARRALFANQLAEQHVITTICNFVAICIWVSCWMLPQFSRQCR